MGIFNNKIGALSNVDPQMGQVSFSSINTLINQYNKTINIKKKESIYAEMLSHPALKSANPNNSNIGDFLTFVGKNKAEVEKFSKGPLKTAFNNLSLDLKSVMKTRFGINVSGEIKTSNDVAQKYRKLINQTSEMKEAASKKDTDSRSAITQKAKDARPELRELNQEIKFLENKSNRTTEEEVKLKELLQIKTELKVAYKDYRKMMHEAKMQTTELDNIFTSVDLFKPHELFDTNLTSQFKIESIEQNQKTSDLSSSMNSISQKLYASIKELISDIRGSKVREMLAEAKKEIKEELEKIEKNKEQFRKDLEAIEKRKITDKELDGRIQTLKNTVKSIDMELNKEVDDLISKLPKEVQKEIKGLENKLKAAFQSILNDKTLSSDEKMMIVVNMLKKFDEMIKNQISNPNNQTNNQLDSQKILENISKAFPNIIANASTGLNVKNDRAALIMDDTEMMLDKLENDSVDSISKTLGLPKNQVEVILNKLSPEQKKTIQTIGDIKKALKDIVNEIKKITNKGSMELNLADTEKDTQKVLEQIENTIGDIKGLIKGSKLTINQLMEANTILLALDNMEKKIESGQESPQKSVIA